MYVIQSLLQPVSDDDSSEDEDSSVEDIEELEVKTEAVNIADESLHESPITSPIKDPSPIITVESPELVSDYGEKVTVCSPTISF